MQQAVPELFESQPELAFRLVTLLLTDRLKKTGVNVHALDPRSGQFVITFPQVCHAGFNAFSFGPIHMTGYKSELSVTSSEYLIPMLEVRVSVLTISKHLVSGVEISDNTNTALGTFRP